MRLAGTVISALIGARIAGGLARVRLGPGPSDRLAAIPTSRLPLSHPVTIHWDEHHIPFIEAQTDGDAACGLGLVHAHLRLVQMEVMRHLATGRVAEMLGPAALPLDYGLRLLGIARPVPAILDMLPAWTRTWVQGFAAGITAYVRETPSLPPEFPWLGLKREAWSAADVLAVGRLASADANWVILFNMLKLIDRADWPELWAGLVDHEGASLRPSIEDEDSLLGSLATGFSRSGSNAIAIAGHRSASGAALMASDPHLSLSLPNLWLLGGVKSPSVHATGLMIPGLPFIAVGRNRDIAWSGTCMQAASSELFDASRLPARTRQTIFACRMEKHSEGELRETRLGPIVSDSPLVKTSRTLALAWVGHRPSDELSAWLGIARATDWRGFAVAADRMAVPGQNLIYADRRGRIGKLLAAHLPRRPPGPPPDLVQPPARDGAWDSLVSSRDLPAIVDPKGGIVASANERPRHADVRVGLFFPGHDRFLRLHRLAGRERRLDLDDLASMQHDVHSESALDLKAWLESRLAGHPLAAVLDNWDGRYDAEATGPAALELLLDRLHGAVHGDAGQDCYWASWNPTQLLRRRLAEADAETMDRAIVQAADSIAADLPRWGDIHRLRLGHMLSALPGLGRLGRFADLPASGGNDTLMKTAHGLTGPGRHPVRFGANARFLTDLGDLDSTRAVLLGGQDGWPGSKTFLDQLEPWRRGETIALPLRIETVRALFPHRTTLRP